MKTVSSLAILAGMLGMAFGQEHQAPPKPGPEHALLKQRFEGEWDAVGKPPRKDTDKMVAGSKGSESARMAALRGDMMGGVIVVGADRSEGTVVAISRIHSSIATSLLLLLIIGRRSQSFMAPSQCNCSPAEAQPRGRN